MLRVLFFSLFIIISNLYIYSNTENNYSKEINPQDLAKVEKKFLLETFNFEGRIEPLNFIVYTAETDGFLSEIFVKEGERVEKGRALFKIDQLPSKSLEYKPVIVRALNSGIVSALSFVKGSLVKSKDEILKVLDIQAYLIKTYISDKDFLRFKNIKEIQVSLESGEKFKANLFKKSLEPDYKTALYDLTFSFSSSKFLLGTYAKVKVIAGGRTALTVIKGALKRELGSISKITLLIDGEKVIKEITTGLEWEGFVEVLEGLREGDLYIVNKASR